MSDHPLRLATGSHKAGSGKGCAMNVISWENGDKAITDFPACSARPLARLVQIVNDTICDHRDKDLLCAECSQVVLGLGHATVGTAGVSREREAPWWAWLMDAMESLTEHSDAIRSVGDLYRRRSRGDEPRHDEWAASYATARPAYGASAASAAYDAAATAAYTAYASDAYTASTAYASDAYATDAYATAACAAACAAAYASDAYASDAYATFARLAFARRAISAWHDLCGTAPAVQSPEVTACAVKKMLVKA